jgi:hypothetical protein
METDAFALGSSDLGLAADAPLPVVITMGPAVVFKPLPQLHRPARIPAKSNGMISAFLGPSEKGGPRKGNSFSRGLDSSINFLWEICNRVQNCDCLVAVSPGECGTRAIFLAAFFQRGEFSYIG